MCVRVYVVDYMARCDQLAAQNCLGCGSPVGLVFSDVVEVSGGELTIGVITRMSTSAAAISNEIPRGRHNFCNTLLVQRTAFRRSYVQ